MSKAFDLVAVGDALVDVVARCDVGFLDAQGLKVDDWVRVDAERAVALHARMTGGEVTPGGSAANTACGVASLGGRAGFIGKLGQDDLGDVFHRALDAAGVAYATPRHAAAATGRSLIHVTPDGLRSMATCLGAAEALDLADLDAGWLRRARVVKLEAYLFQTDRGRALAAHAASVARAGGAKVALSLSSAGVVRAWRAEILRAADAWADVVLGDVEETEALFGRAPEPSDLLPGRSLAMTLGARGSRVIADGAATEVRAWPVERVVDTTGAGDQYAAGFLFGLARGLAPARAGELGARCAAEVITHTGPRPQSPLRSLAEAFGVGLGEEE